MGLPYRDLAPIGSTITTMASAVPDGFLVANGAEISRDTYASLFAAIGTDYGDGDGATTFNLPDSRGQFPRYADDGAGVDPDAGARLDRGDGTTGDAVGTKQGDVFKQHNHLLWQGHTINANIGGGFIVKANWAKGGGVAIFRDGTGNSTVAADGSSESRPCNIYVRMLVRAF